MEIPLRAQRDPAGLRDQPERRQARQYEQVIRQLIARDRPVMSPLSPLHVGVAGVVPEGETESTVEVTRAPDSDVPRRASLRDRLLKCVNLGHGQQEIIEAAYKQMQKLQYSTTFLGISTPPMIECSQRLAKLTPEGLDYFHFTSGGSESTETAYRLARLYWTHKGSQRHKIISLYDSYHGIALGSCSADGLGRGFFSRGAGPTIPGFIHIPNYHCYHCMMGLKYPSCGVACAHFLEETIIREGSDSVAAFVVEPEHGTAGSISPPPEYFPIVSKICAKHDVLLVVDEVMTGFGRTGKMFAVEHWNIVPDIMTGRGQL